MPFEFKLPDVGEGIAEGEIVKWLVKEGDSVKEDQTLVQVETDKAVVDLPSPKAGNIIKINYKEGDSVKVGSTLVLIGEAGEKVKVSKEERVKESSRGKSVVGQLPEAPEEEEKPMAQVMRAETQSRKVLTTPAIRKTALEMNLDLKEVKGSGESGRILMKDIQKFDKQDIPQQNVPVKKIYGSEGYVERIPLKGIRKTMAINMVKSMNETAQVTIMGDANIQRLWNIREKEKKSLEKKGIKLTMLPFIIKAVTTTLKENPVLNSSLESEEIILKKYYNIGIAVETEVGLMVPNIKGADHKNISDLAKEINVLSDKARKRTISLEDMQKGTFTITNYGSYGGKYATPIINIGESAILGIGTIFDHTQSEKAGVKVRKILPLSLTFDHRIIDGSQAAQFLKTLITYLEDPAHLLIEID